MTPWGRSLHADLPPSFLKGGLVILLVVMTTLMVYQSKRRPTVASVEGVAGVVLGRQIEALEKQAGVSGAFGYTDAPLIEQKDGRVVATIIFHLAFNKNGGNDVRECRSTQFEWDGSRWKTPQPREADPRH